jgi:hypothetical protein
MQTPGAMRSTATSWFEKLAKVSSVSLRHVAAASPPARPSKSASAYRREGERVAEKHVL